MKTVIFLLSVAILLVDSGILPAAHRQHRNHNPNLEKVIDLAGHYIHTLKVRADQTEFFCEAETILASVKKDMFGEGKEFVRHLTVYNKHQNCAVVEKSQGSQVDGNQVELRILLEDLKECGRRINSKP
uniref:Uncharacterized protein n=1 Tax=Hucho hucho TaxID=62062 RepID=A0A4W5Q6T2_9TELE